MDSEMPAKTTIAVTEQTSSLIGELSASLGESKLSFLHKLIRIANSMDFNQLQTVMQAVSTIENDTSKLSPSVSIRVEITVSLYCRPSILPLVEETLREEFNIRISST